MTALEVIDRELARLHAIVDSASSFDNVPEFVWRQMEILHEQLIRLSEDRPLPSLPPPPSKL